MVLWLQTWLCLVPGVTSRHHASFDYDYGHFSGGSKAGQVLHMSTIYQQSMHMPGPRRNSSTKLGKQTPAELGTALLSRVQHFTSIRKPRAKTAYASKYQLHKPTSPKRRRYFAARMQQNGPTIATRLGWSVADQAVTRTGCLAVSRTQI